MQDMFDTNKIKPQAQQKEQAQAQKSCFVDHKYLLTLANLRPTLICWNPVTGIYDALRDLVHFVQF